MLVTNNSSLFLLSKALLDAFCKFAVKKFVAESYIKEKLSSCKFLAFQKNIFLSLYGASSNLSKKKENL